MSPRALFVLCAAVLPQADALKSRRPAPASLQLSRRAAATAAVSTLLAPFAKPASAATVATAKVAAYPALQYLEPVYELKLSLDALAGVALGDANRWPALQKRLDAFFRKGGLLSEANYFKGLSLQYIKEIKYDDLDEFVRADREERQAAMDDALGGMQALLSRLEAPPADAAGLAADARRAQNGIARWLLAVPAADVAAVDSLYKAVRMADSDRNGQLSEAELATLPAEQASVWRAKVALVGE